MGLSSSSFHETRFYCYNRSDSLENINAGNQYMLKMQRKAPEPTDKEKSVLFFNQSISCISQLPTKSIYKLQNLKKKVTKFKRKINSSGLDYSKLFYEFISNWSTKELQALKHEYDAMSILKELEKQSIDSRPVVSSLMQDLDGLLKSGLFADTEISYRGEIFKVHRALLSTRSVFFRQCFYSWKAQPDIMLSSYHSVGSTICGSCQQQKQIKKPIPIHLDNPSVTPAVFKSILQYIYTEQLDIDEDLIDNWDMIYLLREKFHLPNRLQFDMKRLFEDSSDTDCVLVFSQSSDILNLDFSPFEPKHLSQNNYLMNFIRHCHFNTGSNNASVSNNNNASSLNFDSPDETSVDYENSFPLGVSYDVPCHRAILAARSTFFKRIIELKLLVQTSEIRDSNSSNSSHLTSFESIISAPMRITLEENIISHRYARVLLYCIYTGQLNLQLIVTRHYPDRRSPTLDLTASLRMQTATGSQSTHHVASMDENPSAAGLYIHTFVPSCINCIRDVMQLYQIGSFLDFRLLCHLCEDLLIKHITLENFLEILRWSTQPFGSQYVRRHVISWIRDEFQQVIYSPFLCSLTKSDLMEIVSSPFTQAPESEILIAILKWGEAQLESPVMTKENKDSKDNSIVILLKDLYSKRSQSKNKYANDPILGKLIQDFLPFVNFQHLFPGTDSLMLSLVRRGVLCLGTNFSDLSDHLGVMQVKQSWCRMINPREIRTDLFMSAASATPGNSSSVPITHQSKYNILSLDLPQSVFDSNTAHHLQPHQYHHKSVALSSFKGPRFVISFYDQLKSMISERSRNSKPIKPYDDSVLHEIESMHPPGRLHPILIPPSQSQFPLLSMQHICVSDPNNTTQSKPSHHYLNCRIINAIHKRVKDLQSSVLVQRALFMPCVSWVMVFHQLRLQALREFGLNDTLLPEIFNESVTTMNGSSYETEIINNNNNISVSNNLNSDIPVHMITPIPVIRSFANLNRNPICNNSKNIRLVHKSGKNNLTGSRHLSYYQSNNTIQNCNSPEIENSSLRNCQCKDRINSNLNNKKSELNLMTILSRTDSNLYKNNYGKKICNSYPRSPSILLLPSTLELKSDIKYSTTRSSNKNSFNDINRQNQFPSRRHSMKLFKNNNTNNLSIDNNGFITLQSQIHSENEIRNDESIHSYNPWVFNGFNFKTNNDLLDNETRVDADNMDSFRDFYGESPKTHSPIYGVRKSYHHSLCVACNNLSHSTFQLNIDSKHSDNFLSKEVEL